MVWVPREEETKMSGRGTGNLVCSSTSDPVFITSILSCQIGSNSSVFHSKAWHPLPVNYSELLGS